MNTLDYSPYHVRLLRNLLLSLAVASASLMAVNETSDSFAIAPPRASGGALTGLAVERGDGRWSASPHYHFAGDGTESWIAPRTGRAGSAQVTVPPDFRALRLGLDVMVASDAVGWIAVGFGPAGNVSDSNFNGGLFLYLNSKGGSQIRVNGLKIKLADKHIPDFRPGELNRLHLVYDRPANSVSARINETEVAGNVPLPDFTPEIFFAGFSSFGTNDRSRIDNFSLQAETGWSPPAAPLPDAADAYRVLFIGDSITQSRAQVVPGWNITAGMAASSPDKDYVTLVCDGIASRTGRKVTRKVIADQGGKVGGYLGRTPQYRAFAPHLTIIQFGENERGTAAQFAQDYEALLKDVSGLSPRPAIICTGIWFPDARYPYAGRPAEMEAVVQKLARAYGAGYAPVGRYAVDPACKGYGDSHGVRWHPNDAGMKGYATEILIQWTALAGRLSTQN